MTFARRELIVGAVAAVATAGIGIGTAHHATQAPAIDVAALVLPGVDILLLHTGGDAARSLLTALRAMPGAGRVIARPITLLEREGFTAVEKLLARARGVHLVALADPAQGVALEVMIDRADVVPRRIITAAGDMVLTAQL